MKILQINATYKAGSTGSIVRLISEMLDRHGIDNAVVCQHYSGEDKNVFGISSPLDMKLHALFSRISGKNAAYSKRATQKVFRIIEDFAPDIVHLHNLHNNYVNLKMLLDFIGKKQIKTVVTLHDCWFFTGKCTHFVKCGCTRWETGCRSCPQLKQDIPSWFFDKTDVMRKEKQHGFSSIKDLSVVGSSDWIADLARRSLLKNGKISTIHTGIDTSVFTPEGESVRKDLGLEDKFVVLGMANKWLMKENTEILNDFINNTPENYHLVLVGAEGKNTDKVTYIDFVSDKPSLARVYRAADVFVNTTFEDTLPTVNIEALGCGTPVITYDSCGSGEIVGEGCGYVIPQLDFSALLKALEKIEKSGRASYSEKCRKHICENYNSETQYEKYLEIYKGD